MKNLIPIGAIIFFFLTLFSISVNNINLMLSFGLVTIILFIFSTPKSQNNKFNNDSEITNQFESLERMLEKEKISYEEIVNAKEIIFNEKNNSKL